MLVNTTPQMRELTKIYGGSDVESKRFYPDTPTESLSGAKTKGESETKTKGKINV
jgi:hypothetical protein